MMKTFAAILSLFVVGCVVGDPGDGSNDEDILGGTEDFGDPAVVQLRFRVAGSGGVGMASCTATVIAPDVLLTAAHCAGGFSYEYNPKHKADPFGASTGWIATSTPLAHPAYTGNASAGHDVAIVQLWSPTAITPLKLGPAPDVGSTVRAIGYGLTTASTSGPSGVKYTVNMRVASVATKEFVAGVDLQGTCHGDSGGPIMQAGRVVGVTSYGTTADCRGRGHYMRVDNNRAFINLYVGP